MAYWFHRNPLKSTTMMHFDLSMVAAQPQAIQICSELRKNRLDLIEALSNPATDPVTTEKLLNSYLGLMMGFIISLDGRGGSSSKLRHSMRFKWTNSMLGQTPSVQQDAIFEMISICQEYAFYLMKHSAFLAAKEDIKMEETKEVHHSLRKASGVLKTIQTEYVDQLLEKPEPGSDIDPRVSNAYVLQCMAEAQEVTIARAIELKHASSLISALSNETSKLFLSAASAVKALDPPKFGKWMRYFQLKSLFYEAYAYCFHGDNLLSLEKCGEAIRALQESLKSYEAVLIMCDEYKKFKGPGMSAKPEEHLFFRRLKPLIIRIKEKCERENSMIFHQKVTQDPPVLQDKATHGLANPIDFTIPPISDLWTIESYAAFDLSKNINPNDPANSKAAKAAEGPIPKIDEKPIPMSSKDPKTNSGCTVQ